MRGAEKGRRELPGSREGASGSGGAEPEGVAAKLVLAKAAPALLPSSPPSPLPMSSSPATSVTKALRILRLGLAPGPARRVQLVATQSLSLCPPTPPLQAQWGRDQDTRESVAVVVAVASTAAATVASLMVVGRARGGWLHTHSSRHCPGVAMGEASGPLRRPAAAAPLLA